MKVGHQNFRHLVSTGVSRRTLLKTTGGGLGLLLLQPAAQPLKKRARNS